MSGISSRIGIVPSCLPVDFFVPVCVFQSGTPSAVLLFFLFFPPWAADVSDVVQVMLLLPVSQFEAGRRRGLL